MTSSPKTANLSLRRDFERDLRENDAHRAVCRVVGCDRHGETRF